MCCVQAHSHARLTPFHTHLTPQDAACEICGSEYKMRTHALCEPYGPSLSLHGVISKKGESWHQAHASFRRSRPPAQARTLEGLGWSTSSTTAVVTMNDAAVFVLTMGLGIQKGTCGTHNSNDRDGPMRGNRGNLKSKET